MKLRFLRQKTPLAEEELAQRWPRMSYLSGIDMESWGGGEVIDPGIKSGGRLHMKAQVKYRGNCARLWRH